MANTNSPKRVVLGSIWSRLYTFDALLAAALWFFLPQVPGMLNAFICVIHLLLIGIVFFVWEDLTDGQPNPAGKYPDTEWGATKAFIDFASQASLAQSTMIGVIFLPDEESAAL